MFRCELCKTIAPSGLPSQKVITETRPAEYPSRVKAQRQRIGRKLKHADDPGGAGYEIAREAVACPSCASAHEAQRPRDDDASVDVSA